MLLSILYISFFNFNAQAEGMTIEEAYREQNHQRTQFDLNTAKMSEAEAKYLDHLFFVTDVAFRERMMMLRHFRAGTDNRYITEYNKEINNAIASFTFIKAPTRILTKVEVLVITSIQEQKSLFNKWHNARGTALYKNLNRNYTSHELVQKSHKHLIQAYGLLKGKYRSENKHNQQSFYDHLCALDFI